MHATVHLDTQHHVGPIDRRIFGGFLEHLGRAVYEGVYDPASPLSDAKGYRRDVLEALRAMGMPAMRYPGGNYVSCCDWKDGIGPRDKRPARPDYAWRSVESNQFGVDEFADWCRELGTSPMMAVNLGTGSLADAAQLVEYCNLAAGTAWADRRVANGHAEPYGIRLWCLGNEMDGPWQAGYVPADVYAYRAAAASILMKGLDRSIQTIACGSSGRSMKTYMEWDRVVLEHCWDTIDFISAHRYSNNHRNDSAWFLAEGVEIDRVLADYAGLIAYVRGLKRSDKNVYLSFDEWNVWYKAQNMDGGWTKAPHLVEEVYNLEDALVCAQYLSAFVRRADLVKMACIAQIVNVIAPMLTRPDGLLLQATYYPFVLYSQSARGLSLVPAVHAPMYKAGERGDVPALDVSATYDDRLGVAAVFLVNRSMSEEMTVNVSLADRRFGNVLAADVMGGQDVKAANSWENRELVKPVKGTATVTEGGLLRVTVPKPGLAVVRVETTAR